MTHDTGSGQGASYVLRRNLALKVRKLLEVRNLSQRAAAEQIGCSHSQIQMLLRDGKHQCGRMLMQQLRLWLNKEATK